MPYEILKCQAVREHLVTNSGQYKTEHIQHRSQPWIHWVKKKWKLQKEINRTTESVNIIDFCLKKLQALIEVRFQNKVDKRSVFKHTTGSDNYCQFTCFTQLAFHQVTCPKLRNIVQASLSKLEKDRLGKPNPTTGKHNAKEAPLLIINTSFQSEKSETHNQTSTGVRCIPAQCECLRYN